jgi:hypothetical protein
MPTAYKIRRKSDGKFSTGTTNPDWTSVGKLFACRGALISHINFFRQGPGYLDHEGDYTVMRKLAPNLSDYEVVSYEISELEVTDLLTFLEPR